MILSVKYPDWRIVSNLLDCDFEQIFEEIDGKVARYEMTMYGKTFEVKKLSCIMTETPEGLETVDAKSKGFSYGKLPIFSYSTHVSEIRKQIESFFGVRIDYALIHLYRDEKDYIGWHHDKEAMQSDIISVSLGCPRRFDFKIIATDELSLSTVMEHGDILHMYGPRKDRGSCQEYYLHRVDPMKLSDLKELITDRGLKLPSGRASFENYGNYAKENGIDLRRINITFRQYESSDKVGSLTVEPISTIRSSNVVLKEIEAATDRELEELLSIELKYRAVFGAWNRKKVFDLRKYAAEDRIAGKTDYRHWLVLDDQEVAGYVGLHPCTEGRSQVRVFTFPTGKGYGAKAIELLTAIVKYPIVALVAKDNVSSNALFSKRWRLIREEKAYGKLHNLYSP